MAEEKKIATGYIGNALRSSAADHTTTFADEIFDTERQKYQNEVNTDLETTDNEIKANLEAETARAKAAEQANAQAIAEEKAAIMGTDRIADGTVTLDKIAHESVDDEPTVGSDNLVKSGGVADKLAELGLEVNNVKGYKDVQFDFTSGNISAWTNRNIPYVFEKGKEYKIQVLTEDSTINTYFSLRGNNYSEIILNNILIGAGKRETTIIAPNDASHLYMSYQSDGPAIIYDVRIADLAALNLASLESLMKKPIEDSSITTSKLADNSVTKEKIAPSAYNSVLLTSESVMDWEYSSPNIYITAVSLFPRPSSVTISDLASLAAHLGVSTQSSPSGKDSVVLAKGYALVNDNGQFEIVENTNIKLSHQILLANTTSEKGAVGIFAKYKHVINGTIKSKAITKDLMADGIVYQGGFNISVINEAGVPNIVTSEGYIDFGESSKPTYLAVGNNRITIDATWNVVFDGRKKLYFKDGTAQTSSSVIFLFVDKKNKKFVSLGQNALYSIANDQNYIAIGVVQVTWSEDGRYSPNSFKQANLCFNYTVNGKSVIANESITKDKIDKDFLKEIQGDIDTTSIFYHNPESLYKDLFQQAERAANEDGYIQQEPQLVLCHFSDIHGYGENLKRLVQFCDKYKEHIDDILHTGDIVNNSWDDDFTFWETNGGAKILNCLGNHDVLVGATSGISPTMQQQYNRYFKPYISSWNVTQPNYAEENGLCYYYKDYTAQKIRLIVLDCMNWNSTQNTFLQNSLNSAKSSGLSVIIANHFPLGVLNKTKNSFDTLQARLNWQQNNNETMANEAEAAVQSFINNGGDFVCWIAGHTHMDYFGTLVNYPDQVYINVANAGCHDMWNDAKRVVGTKSQDLFNIIAVDVHDHIIKLFRVGADYDRWLRHKGTLCFNYKTKETIWNS